MSEITEAQRVLIAGTMVLRSVASGAAVNCNNNVATVLATFTLAAGEFLMPAFIKWSVAGIGAGNGIGIYAGYFSYGTLVGLTVGYESTGNASEYTLTAFNFTGAARTVDFKLFVASP